MTIALDHSEFSEKEIVAEIGRFKKKNDTLLFWRVSDVLFADGSLHRSNEQVV